MSSIRPPLSLKPHIACVLPQTAMVMAAGLGKRMRPLTATRPKPLIDVAGRSLLDRALDGVAAAGVEHAVVNAHYFADQIEAAVKVRGTKSLGPPHIDVSDERGLLLETGGDAMRWALLDLDTSVTRRGRRARRSGRRRCCVGP